MLVTAAGSVFISFTRIRLPRIRSLQTMRHRHGNHGNRAGLERMKMVWKMSHPPNKVKSARTHAHTEREGGGLETVGKQVGGT